MIFRRYRNVVILLAGIVPLSACLYRMDVPQGNRIDAAAIGQLRSGMTRAQVEFLLGSPAIVDNYNPDRWHYVYYLKPGDGEVDSRLLTLEFDGDQLRAFDGAASLEQDLASDE